jgi:ribosome-associated protein
MSEPDDDAASPEPVDRRQVARRARREAGVDSAKLAHTLMKLPASALPKLGLDDDVLEDVARARAVTAQIARRRAERTLAGSLRRVDTSALAARIETVLRTGLGDPGRLHQAERWRARLLDEPGALEMFRAAYPTSNLNQLPRFIDNARRERTTGKPPGGGRALFRQISAVLEQAARAAEEAEEEGPEGAPIPALVDDAGEDDGGEDVAEVTESDADVEDLTEADERDDADEPDEPAEGTGAAEAARDGQPDPR